MSDGRVVYLTDGYFRITDWGHRHNAEIAIEHKCPDLPTNPNRPWLDHVYHAKNRGKACRGCGEIAPEGLQAAFWFLFEDSRNG